MTDYWKELKLSECWSERERFNKMMTYILEGVDEEGE